MLVELKVEQEALKNAKGPPHQQRLGFTSLVPNSSSLLAREGSRVTSDGLTTSREGGLLTT